MFGKVVSCFVTVCVCLFVAAVDLFIGLMFAYFLSSISWLVPICMIVAAIIYTICDCIDIYNEVYRKVEKYFVNNEEEKDFDGRP